ncbi:22411_t:CDS:2, partial [Cetraspora pellucida]
MTHESSDECKNEKQLQETNLTEQEWTLLKDLLQVLGPFAAATQYLGSSYYSMHSLMHHVIEKLKEIFKPTITNTNIFNIKNEEDAFDYDKEQINQDKTLLNNLINTISLLNEVKEKIYTTLCHYYPNLASQELIFALLDPQLKLLDFVNMISKSVTKNILKNLYNKEKSLKNEQTSSEYENEDLYSINNNQTDNCIIGNDLLYISCLLKSLEKDNLQ